MHIWEGKKVRIRAVAVSDWERFHQNDFDSEAARSCDVIYFPRSPEGTQLYVEQEARRIKETDNVWLSIETLDGQLVGSISTHASNRRFGTFKYGIAIFRDYWRLGYATESIMLLLRYFFEELGYQKASAHVYSFNHGSIRLHEKLGFQLEGRLRRTVFTEGQYFDEIVFGVTNDEFALIKNQYLS